MTRTPTRTLTGTPTPAITPTPTPGSFEDPGPEYVRFLPNPWQGDAEPAVWINLLRPVDSMRLKVYTTAHRKIAEWSWGPAPVGQAVFPLGEESFGLLANGLYYAVLETPHGKVLGVLLIRK